MSPYYWTGSYANIFLLDSSGTINFNYVHYARSLVPSISIDINAPVEENTTGEYNNPYIIVTM